MARRKTLVLLDREKELLADLSADPEHVARRFVA
jgi:hypothetical protein